MAAERETSRNLVLPSGQNFALGSEQYIKGGTRQMLPATLSLPRGP